MCKQTPLPAYQTEKKQIWYISKFTWSPFYSSHHKNGAPREEIAIHIVSFTRSGSWQKHTLHSSAPQCGSDKVLLHSPCHSCRFMFLLVGAHCLHCIMRICNIWERGRASSVVHIKLDAPTALSLTHIWGNSTCNPSREATRDWICALQ